MNAAERADVAAMQLLLAAGADANAKTPGNTSALQSAAASGNLAAVHPCWRARWM
jgi:ankyrin repeat protein